MTTTARSWSTSRPDSRIPSGLRWRSDRLQLLTPQLAASAGVGGDALGQVTRASA
jgi:hypothetical protein